MAGSRIDSVRIEAGRIDAGRPDAGRPDAGGIEAGRLDGGRIDGGRVVPVYALTGGRTRSAGAPLPIEALVTTTERAARPADDLQREHRQILELVTRPVSVAEVGAGLGVPVGVARVLVAGLAHAGYLLVHLPEPGDGRPSKEILERLLNGLRTR